MASGVVTRDELSVEGFLLAEREELGFADRTWHHRQISWYGVGMRLLFPNPSKGSWFTIGVGAGVVVSGLALSGYIFRRLQKL